MGADRRLTCATGAAGAPGMPGVARRLLTAGLAGLVAAVVAVVVAAALPGAARGADWRVGASVSERLQAESNHELDDDGAPVYGTTTAFGLDVTALTPTTEWRLETGASVGVFGGSGETDDLNGVFPNLATTVSHDGKHVDTGASFSIALEPASFAQTGETAAAAGNATQLTIRFGTNAAMALDPRNRLSFGVSGRVVRFTSGTTELEPTTTYGTSLSWGHSLSAASEVTVGLGVRRFTTDSADDEKSVTADLSVGLGHRVDPRLAFNVGLGVSATRTRRTVLGLEETQLDLGATGDLGLDWQPRADTQISLALSHGLVPSERGRLETTTALGAGLQHAFNSRINGSVDFLLQRQRAIGGAGDRTVTASLSPGLSFSLTPEVALRLSYALRMERENAASGLAVSNGVFLTLTRAFTLLP